MVLIKAVNGSGRVGFRPNSDSTRQRRVEGRSNPKPIAGKISRFNFLWWLASIGSDRLSELRKASKYEKKCRRNLELSPETRNSYRNLENSHKKTGFFLKFAFFFARNCWVWPDLARFFCSFGQVRVAQVLEMWTRHSTCRCRFLRTETCCRPTGPSVRAGIGLSSGGLAGLSGFGWVWIALVLIIRHWKIGLN